MKHNSTFIASNCSLNFQVLINSLPSPHYIIQESIAPKITIKSLHIPDPYLPLFILNKFVRKIQTIIPAIQIYNVSTCSLNILISKYI